MSEMKAYRSATPFLRTVAPRGEPVQFVGHYFYTDDPYLIEFLDTFTTIKGGMIQEDKNAPKYSADPMEDIKKKAVEEFLATQQAQAEPQDRGNSTSQLVVGTSQDLPGSEKLANMKKTIKV